MSILSGPNSPHRPTAVFVVVFVLIAIGAYHLVVNRER